ncbi:GNAT family N-acetyltransferase [Roseibium sp. FZY0029]|uniref:GNAT family N-acetyltransferase n=1 Tax=Roseibium sp. FZY0029 TaxID=3116647 RepID=UPI002E9B7E5D|nr:GNAT family N-acetyltransferase [Roseibium sp. FZY0029]
MQSQIDIGAFGPEHIDGALALTRAENWPHRREDWMLVQQLSTGVVATDAEGRVTGTTLVTPYGDDCATINMVIVDKSMRGLGVGRKLMEEAFVLAGDRPLRLIATQEGLPLYEKLGFVATGTILQCQGQALSCDTPVGVEKMAAGDLEALKTLDREAYGADRSKMIDALVACGSVAVIRKGSTVEAYAAIRQFGRGDVIGPVIAPDREAARALIAYHASSRPGAFLRIDTGSETGLAPWLAEIGLAHSGGGVAMRRPPKDNAEQARRKVYALANQALG